ncbi:hypothetical protein AWB68_08130 [Caballeronia choica]|uniref:Uncharacterized protein n=1 Tax=Caballeronia choica TaxID=326476 RepID=A0A158L0G7_9BURK|nr:hypothetical protein AWB68_08130 [Caballeronia choica]
MPRLGCRNRTFARRAALTPIRDFLHDVSMMPLLPGHLSGVRLAGILVAIGHLIRRNGAQHDVWPKHADQCTHEAGFCAQSMRLQGDAVRLEFRCPDVRVATLRGSQFSVHTPLVFLRFGTCESVV